jgi:large subunit ribosomal protein L22
MRGIYMANSVKASLPHARISSSKVKIVLNLIRGKDAGEALAILANMPNKAAGLVLKLLKSAIANAEHNDSLIASRLYVSEAFANEGPTMKRIQPRAKGSAYPIFKRTCHITVKVAEREGGIN